MSTPMDGRTCPLCLSRDANIKPGIGRGAVINCPRCSVFAATLEAMDALKRPRADPKQRLYASSWVRARPDTLLREDDLDRLLTLVPPPVGERAERLLQAIATNHGSVGKEFQLRARGKGDLDLQALSWCVDAAELCYLLDAYLVEEKHWITGTGLGTPTYTISAKGHDHLDSLRRAIIDSAQGFCAMWFDAQVQELWSDGIELAIAAAGYKPARMDQIEHANKIDDEILAQIRRSKFVVADFTGQRGGVYFEAGFALGLGLPVLWTVRNDTLEDVHFDNRQYNFIVWTPGDLKTLRTKLTARIVALFGVGPISA